MPVSEAQKRAYAKYRRNKVKEFKVSFYPAHMELYEHLQKQPSKNEYIRNLIAKDMQQNR